VADSDLGYPDTIQQAAAGIAYEGEAKRVVVAHKHRKAELVFLLSGNLTVESTGGIWVVPPGRALWIPAGTVHSSREAGHVTARCIFFDPGIVPQFLSDCRLVFVHPLLGELLERLTQFRNRGEQEAAREKRLIAVLLDELAAAQTEPLHLPLPADQRLQKIVRSLLERPSLRMSTESWCARVGVSPRTLGRLFQKDVGMSFGKWRQHLHIQIALRELARGMLVSKVAYDLGYECTSAFIAMFKRNTGQTPGTLSDRSDHPSPGTGQ